MSALLSNAWFVFFCCYRLFFFSLSSFYFSLQQNIALGRVSKVFRVVFICASLPTETSLFFRIISSIFSFEHSSWRAYRTVCCVCYLETAVLVGSPPWLQSYPGVGGCEGRCIPNVKVIKRQNRKPPISTFSFFFRGGGLIPRVASVRFVAQTSAFSSQRDIFPPLVNATAVNQSASMWNMTRGQSKGNKRGKKWAGLSVDFCHIWLVLPSSLLGPPRMWRGGPAAEGGGPFCTLLLARRSTGSRKSRRINSDRSPLCFCYLNVFLKCC